MSPIDLALGAACCVAFGLTSIGRHGRGRRRDTDDARFAAVLAAVWYLGVVVHTAEDGGIIPDGAGIMLNPPVDLLTAVAVALAEWRRPAPWKRALFMLLALQLVSHVAFGLSARDVHARYGYALGLNITFVFQLMCVGWPGVRHGFSARRRRLPPRAHRLRPRTSRDRSEG